MAKQRMANELYIKMRGEHGNNTKVKICKLLVPNVSILPKLSEDK
ncbi:hypothetical protein SAMN04488136_12136 [Vibrio xiamenensis]|uniref:Uncharacterized protein n=1 Tax=Vibrio xiamenensis TaxID=861298 RepID=A0A1G8DS30_9VIBR|nr:hypothetical protein SAMN04488136_12136 [Vibrio xiamenensis]